MFRRLLFTTSAAVTACFGLVSGCALDWDVRADPGDASPAADTSISDVGMPDTATDAPDDATTDAPTADCTALASDVETARLKAKDCTLGLVPTQCSTTATDACSCPIIVNAASTSLVSAYESAVSTYLASCTPDCSAPCKPLGNPTTWSCLEVGTPRAQCTP